MNVISLFAGGGLMDLGFIGNFTFLGKHYPPTGLRVIWACDFEKTAVEAYKHNIGNHIVEADITTLMPPKAEGVVGGPPCQDYSVAGVGKGEEGDRGKLVWDYLKKVDTLQPDFFCFENVEGITQKKHRHTLEALLTQLSKLGYKVYWKVLNAWHYGVAQTRKRVFIVGFRNHNIRFKWPDKVEYWPVLRDVIGDLPEPYQVQDYRNIQKEQNGKGYRTVDEPSYAVDTWGTGGVSGQPPNHKKFDNENCNPTWEHANRIADINKPAPARTEKDRCDGLIDPRFKNHIQTESTTVKPSTYNQRNYKAEAEIHPGPMNHSNVRQLTLNEIKYQITAKKDSRDDLPSRTLMARGDNGYHTPTQPRRFTVRECLRIQSVPDSYIFPDTISLSAQYRITGNGVPSILAWHLANSIREALEGVNKIESASYVVQEILFG